MSLLNITDQLKDLKSCLIAFDESQKNWGQDLESPSFDNMNDQGYQKIVDMLMAIYSKSRDVYNMVNYLLDFIGEHHANNISVEELEAMATLASEYDASGDEVLIRQAQMLDLALQKLVQDREQIRIKLAEKETEQKIKNKYLDREREEKYDKPRETIAELNKTQDLGKKYSDKMKGKEYRQQQHALSTRYCPEHPGVGVIPLAEGQYQCSLDNKVFNYKEGYTSIEGDKVPGGAVEMQNQLPYQNMNTKVNYDTRESRSQK